MKNSFEDTAKKYKEEMMKLYRKKQNNSPSAVQVQSNNQKNTVTEEPSSSGCPGLEGIKDALDNSKSNPNKSDNKENVVTEEPSSSGCPGLEGIKDTLDNSKNNNENGFNEMIANSEPPQTSCPELANIKSVIDKLKNINDFPNSNYNQSSQNNKGNPNEINDTYLNNIDDKNKMNEKEIEDYLKMIKNEDYVNEYPDSYFEYMQNLQQNENNQETELNENYNEPRPRCPFQEKVENEENSNTDNYQIPPELGGMQIQNKTIPVNSINNYYINYDGKNEDDEDNYRYTKNRRITINSSKKSITIDTRNSVDMEKEYEYEYDINHKIKSIKNDDDDSKSVPVQYLFKERTKLFKEPMPPKKKKPIPPADKNLHRNDKKLTNPHRKKHEKKPRYPYYHHHNKRAIPVQNFQEFDENQNQSQMLNEEDAPRKSLYDKYPFPERPSYTELQEKSRSDEIQRQSDLAKESNDKLFDSKEEKVEIIDGVQPGEVLPPKFEIVDEDLETYGELTVVTRTARDAFPVQDAIVIVESFDEKNGERNVLKVLKSNRSGLTSTVDLPAPPKKYSLTPGSKIRPYSYYDILVSADGYYRMVYKNVPVFEGVKSVQSVDLIPLPSDAEKKEKIIKYIESEPNKKGV